MLATLFFSAIFFPSMASAGYWPVKTLTFPAETANSYVEMFPAQPLALKAFTLCMQVATELSGKREVILFAYRTKHIDELNVWRELDGRLSFYLSGGGVYFKVIPLKSTHLCVTWDSSSGAATLYINGRRSLMKIYKKGHRVRAGGRVILGQDPDSFLGNFDVKQSFVGEISDVNMWDSVLYPGGIEALYSKTFAPIGNIFDWERAKLKIHGQVEVALK